MWNDYIFVKEMWKDSFVNYVVNKMLYVDSFGSLVNNNCGDGWKHSILTK